MAVNIALPGLGRPKSVKDAVISVLSIEWPLTSKTLYNRVRKDCKLSVTYQAVHKALKELVEDGVLEKKNKEYNLNSEWIKKIHDFVQSIMSNRSVNNNFSFQSIVNIVETGGFASLEFENLLELDNFNLKIHDYFYPQLNNAGNNIVCMHFKHQWWHMIYPIKEYPVGKNNSKFFMLCAGKTLLDKQGNEFKEKAGFNVTNADCAHNCDTNVYNDWIIDIYYSPELSGALDNAFSNVKILEELSVPELINTVFKKKSRITVLIKKNKDAADGIRSETLKYFVGGNK